MATSTSGPRGWDGIMLEARLDLSLDDDAVLKLLVAWELANRCDKPPMGKLWWSCNRAWLEQQLGINSKQAAPESPFDFGPPRVYDDEHKLEVVS